MDKILRVMGILIIGMCIITINSCSSYQRDFELIKGQKISENTISIIPGHNSDLDLMFVKFLIKDLQKKSKYKVMKFREMKRIVTSYGNIIEKDGASLEDDPAILAQSLSVQNRNRVANIQKKLGTKYVYVVWADRLQREKVVRNNIGITRTTFYANIYGHMLEYPGNKSVGYTVKQYDEDEGSCLNPSKMFKSDGGTLRELFVNASDIISDKIVEAAQ